MATDIVARLRTKGRVYTHMEAADEIERLRAECQRLAGEVSRAHKDALTWMERAAAARREGIEAAAKRCAEFRSSVQNELDHAPTVQMEAALAAAICGIDKAEAAIRALLEDGR